MNNKEKLYLAKQAAGAAPLDAQGLTELISLMQEQLDNPNVSPEHKANIAQNIKIYQEQLANLAPPPGTGTVLRNDGKTDVAPPSRVVSEGGNPVLQSSQALTENVSSLPADEKPLLIQEALKPPAGVTDTDLADIAANDSTTVSTPPGTPPAGVTDTDLGTIAANDSTTLGTSAQKQPDAGTPWYKNPYILGAGALGLGGLGAYALSGNDDEEEEEEEAYA